METKQQLMQSFLRDAQQAQYASQQAQYASQSQHANQQQTTSTSLVKVEQDGDIPGSLEQFKEYVRAWLELDNTIKKAQKFIREKRQQRNALSMSISKFMCKYDIEDLHTKEGRIRCKVTQVKAPLNQKMVKEKISTILKDDESKSQELIKQLYDEREVTQKVSLRRLKIS